MHKILLTLVAFALFGVACAEDDTTLDLAAIETEVGTHLEAAYGPDGYTLFDVSCPRSAATATGGSVFACVADVERQFVRVRVEVTGTGAYDWSTLDLVLDMVVTEELVAQEMSDRLGDAITLDCGSPHLRVLPIGSTLRCTASDSGRNEVNALLTINGVGQIAWELLD